MGPYPFAAGKSEGTQSETMMISEPLQPVHFINLVVLKFEASGREKVWEFPLCQWFPSGGEPSVNWADGPAQHHSTLKHGQNAGNAQ